MATRASRKHAISQRTHRDSGHLGGRASVSKPRHARHDSSRQAPPVEGVGFVNEEGSGSKGGGRGIRTHDDVAAIAVFKTAALGHYASPPRLQSHCAAHRHPAVTRRVGGPGGMTMRHVLGDTGSAPTCEARASAVGQHPLRRRQRRLQLPPARHPQPAPPRTRGCRDRHLARAAPSGTARWSDPRCAQVGQSVRRRLGREEVLVGRAETRHLRGILHGGGDGIAGVARAAIEPGDQQAGRTG